MHSQILRRTGIVLLAVAVIDGIVTIAQPRLAGSWPAAFDCVAAAAGIYLLPGQPRAALWVRTVAVFLLSGVIALSIAAPLFQPWNLTITEIRLDPTRFATWAAMIGILLCVTLFVAWQLGLPPVRDAIIRAGLTRWDMAIPAQAGAAIVALTGLLLWLTLHGQSADLATSLALQQLGPDYRYHLSWISSAGNGHGTTVTGIVTAWNDKEIKKVLLHWETR